MMSPSVFQSALLGIFIGSISVSANAGPQAIEDHFTTYTNTPISITVPTLLANDIVPPVVDLYYVDDWQNGTVVYDENNGVITFTPDSGFSGTGQFTYGITDVDAQQSWATVTINVTSNIDEAPIVTAPRDDYFTIGAEETLTIPSQELLFNDTNKPGEYEIVYVDDWHGGELSYADLNEAVTFSPEVDFAGEASFTYGFKLKNTTADIENMAYARVIIDVGALSDNHIPVVTNDNFRLQMNDSITLQASQLLANDLDEDVNDVLQITDVFDAFNGSVTFDNEAGLITFIPTAEFTGTAGVSYSIVDLAGGSASGIVTFDVSNSSNSGTPQVNTEARQKFYNALAGKPLMGMNLTGEVYYTAADIYKDKMRSADPWKTSDATGTRWIEDIYFPQIPKRSDGYPTHVPFAVEGTDLLQTLVMPISSGERQNTGRYHVFYQGEGRFDFSGASLLEEVEVGYRIYDFAGEVFLQFHESNIDNPLHGFLIVHEDDLDTYQTQPFNEKLRGSLDDVSVIRLMDMMFTNGNAAQDASHITPINHYTWNDCPGSVCNGGQFAGHPPQVLMQLINYLDVNPWINIPHQANDDYVRAYAELVFEHLEEDKFVFIEYSNELWNWLFPQTKWLGREACENPISRVEYHEADMPVGECDVETSSRRYQTKRSLEIFAIFKDVFGEQSDRVITILAGQGSWSSRTQASLQALDDLTINPNQDTIDAIAIAPYFGGYPQLNTVERRNEFVSASFEQLRERAIQDIESDDVRGSVRIHKQLAQERGMELIAYEGGQHYLCGYNEELNQDFCDDTELRQKISDFQRHTVMEDIYDHYYDMWFGEGGSLFAVFSHMGSADSKFGAWGTLEHYDQPLSETPKRRALLSASERYQLSH